MSFEHDFTKKNIAPDRVESSVRFIATLEGQRSLKDGGLQITLGLAENEFVSVAKLLAMRNMWLEVNVIARDPDTFKP